MRAADILSKGAIVACLALLTTCTNSSWRGDLTPGPSNGSGFITAYIPYVEEVVFPDPIYANEDFSITMRLSSVLEPRLLKGNPMAKLIVAGPDFHPSFPGVACMPMWMRAILPDQGPAVDTVQYLVQHGLPEGKWQIAVETAKTRELGGLSHSYDEGNGGGAYTDNVEYRLCPNQITVVKRPGT